MKGSGFIDFYSVIQSEAKDLVSIHVDVLEILPPFGRLDDKYLKQQSWK